VKEAQQELAAIAKEQAEMDKLRQEQNADFKVAQVDLSLGLSGVQAALEKLREYYSGATAAFVQDDNGFGSFMQQLAPPAKHEKSSGAGQSIIGIHWNLLSFPVNTLGWMIHVPRRRPLLRRTSLKRRWVLKV